MLREVDIGKCKDGNAKDVSSEQEYQTTCQEEQSLPHGSRIGNDKAGVKTQQFQAVAPILDFYTVGTEDGDDTSGRFHLPSQD